MGVFYDIKNIQIQHVEVQHFVWYIPLVEFQYDQKFYPNFLDKYQLQLALKINECQQIDVGFPFCGSLSFPALALPLTLLIEIHQSA